MQRFVGRYATIALVAASAILIGPTGGTAQAASGTLVPTQFAMTGVGFSTRAEGGQLPTGSDTTAYQAFGCTNKAGIRRENHEAAVTQAGLGRLTGLRTDVWTSRTAAGAIASNARNTIATLTLHNAAMGTIEVDAISSFSKAFHNGTGFHSLTRSAIGSITYTPATGASQTIPVPTPGHPAVVPGFATFAVGHSHTAHSASGARAAMNGVEIAMIPSGTNARVAHSAAKIYSGVQHGLFTGFSSGTRAQAADGHVTSGYTPLSLIPCQGTGGRVLTKSITHTNLGNNVVVQGLSSSQLGTQLSTRTSGFERGRIASVNIGGGKLVITGIVGKANVVRVGHLVKRNAAGTTVGSITASGQPKTLPDSGTLEIPGVARIETRIVHKYTTGLDVTAVRITLLDGSGAVINLGEAKLRIRASGL